MSVDLKDRIHCMDYKGTENLDLTGRDPHATYIITEKPLEVADYYRLMGFYNVYVCRDVSEVSEESLADFLATDYEDNRFIYAEKTVREFMGSKMSIGDSLATLLQSIAERDSETFNAIVKYNLGSLLNAINDIKRIYNEHKNISIEDLRSSSLRKKLSECESELADSKGKLVEMDSLREKIKSQADLVNKEKEFRLQCENENKLLADKLAEITQVANGKVEAEELSNLKKDNEILETKYRDIFQKNEEIRVELEGYKSKVNETEFFRDHPDELVSTLRKELDMAKRSQSVEKMKELLPVVGDSTYLRAKGILYLKEIKIAPYMNSFISYLSVLVNSERVRRMNRNIGIVVYDTLYDDYRKVKYKKHGFAVNTVPDRNLVVTSTLTLEYLKNVVNVDSYDFLIVIDRLGFSNPIIKTELTKYYYLIDSENDISDFSLMPEECIGFYEGGSCKYHCVPDGSLGVKEQKQKMYQFTRNNWAMRLLQDSYILEG